ncbi:MAG: GAF and ANTAR domain-containing protein [Mycobacteriaceae bacterium]
MTLEMEPGPTPLVRTGPVHLAVAAQPGAVADIIANLDEPVHDVAQLLALLHRCATLAVETIGPADHVGVTVSFAGQRFTAAFTDELTLDVDLHQYALGHGPCLLAASTGEVVRVDVAGARARWPEFTADAEAIGVRSFLAAPLGADGQWVGALNLYSSGAEGFGADDSDEMAMLSLLSQRASRAVGEYLTLFHWQNLATKLTTAMDSRAAIEQVKGILMAARHISAEEAFAVLRTESQNTNTKLREVAERFLVQHTTPAAAS